MISDNKEIRELLENAKTIAMIGCSPDKYRTSNYAAHFLQERGYRLIPINPKAEEIYGEECYDRLQDVPAEVQIDIVNVFRNSDHSVEAVQDAAEWKSATGQDPVVWTQLDVSSPEAEKIAEDHELSYVRNKCIMVEWDRHFK